MLFRTVRLALVAAVLAGALAWGIGSASAGPMMGMKTGDLNSDGAANSLDALNVLFYDAGMLGKQSPTWDAAADVNCDLSVNTIDASLILQHDAGLYDLRP